MRELEKAGGGQLPRGPCPGWLPPIFRGGFHIICWLQSWLWRADESGSNGLAWTTAASNIKGACTEQGCCMNVPIWRPREVANCRGMCQCMRLRTLSVGLTPFSMESRAYELETETYPIKAGGSHSFLIIPISHANLGKVFEQQTMFLSQLQASGDACLAGDEGRWEDVLDVTILKTIRTASG